MSYNGYLIKLGGASGTILSHDYIMYNKYDIAPNQRLDLDSTRDTTGVLHRTVLTHTATKITVQTVPMNNTKLATMMATIRGAMSHQLSRTIDLQYYDMETDSYKTGTFYMPDTQFTIRSASGNVIEYDSAELSFIEY